MILKVGFLSAVNWKMLIGLALVLALAVFLAVKTCKNKDNDLFKWIGIFLLLAFCLTWIIPASGFQNGNFSDYGMNRLGLGDIPGIIYYAISFCLIAIIYLLALGGLYGVLSKNKSYSALVKKTANLIKGKEILTTIAIIISIVLLTSFFKTVFAVLFFIPFIISVLSNAKYDKVTTMGLTFGSLLIGTLFATYGTDGLISFLSYKEATIKLGMNAAIANGITHRIIIGSIALVLFILYNVYRTVKNNKKVSKEMEVEDLFEVSSTNAKQRIWPAVTLFGVMLVFIILCFVDWNTNFKIEVFNDAHEWFIGPIGQVIAGFIVWLINMGLIVLFFFVLYKIYKLIKNSHKISNLKNKTWMYVLSFGIPIVIFIAFGALGLWQSKYVLETISKIYEWLSADLKGLDYPLFSYILGKGSHAFGTMDVNSLTTITLIVSVIVGLCSKMKLKEFAANYADGVSKMLKPVALYVLTFTIFSISYLTPVSVFITNWAFGLTKAFNPFIATITAFVTSVFHCDLGFTSYSVGSKIASYGEYETLLDTIYVVTHALAQLFLPIGGLLLIGLSYLKLDYKSWFKYIWIFVVAMAVVLLIFVTIATYAV